MAENEKSFVVNRLIPGGDRDDLQISVEYTSVRVGVEVKREKTIKDDENDIRAERYYRGFHRSFTLPSDVDRPKATARYENRILTLERANKPNGTLKKITVP